MFRGVNKIICGVDIIVIRLLRIFFLNEYFINIFVVLELKKIICLSFFVEGNKF